LEAPAVDKHDIAVHLFLLFVVGKIDVNEVRIVKASDMDPQSNFIFTPELIE
jgi:hypothetical protein